MLMVPQITTREIALNIELPPIFALIPPNKAKNEILKIYSAQYRSEGSNKNTNSKGSNPPMMKLKALAPAACNGLAAVNSLMPSSSLA